MNGFLGKLSKEGTFELQEAYFCPAGVCVTHCCCQFDWWRVIVCMVEDMLWFVWLMKCCLYQRTVTGVCCVCVGLGLKKKIYWLCELYGLAVFLSDYICVCWSLTSRQQDGCRHLAIFLLYVVCSVVVFAHVHMVWLLLQSGSVHDVYSQVWHGMLVSDKKQILCDGPLMAHNIQVVLCPSNV